MFPGANGQRWGGCSRKNAVRSAPFHNPTRHRHARPSRKELLNRRSGSHATHPARRRVLCPQSPDGLASGPLAGRATTVARSRDRLHNRR